MNDWRLRVMTEASELHVKISALRMFILTNEKYDELPEIERKDLKEQLSHMENYYKILGQRISRMCNNA